MDAAQQMQVALVQSELGDQLRGSGAGATAIEDAAVVFAELMSNVLRHTPGAAAVSLQWIAGGAVLTVDDHGPGFVPAREPAPDPLAESGRGLLIIAALAEELKVSRRRGGGARVQVRLCLGIDR